MEIVETDRVDQQAWDQRALNAPEATIFQLTALLNRPLVVLDHYRPLFVEARERDEVLGQVMLLEGCWFGRPLGDHLLFPLARPVLNRVFRSHRMTYGPLVFARHRYLEVLDALVGYLDREVFPRGVHASQMVPPVHDPALDQESIRSVFERNGFTAAPAGTFVTDVRPEIEHIWTRLARESRTKVRRAREQEIEIIEVTEETMLREYQRISAEVSRRNGLTVRPWKAFACSLRDPATRIFMSLYRGVPVSGQMAMVGGRVVLLGVVSVSDFAIEERIHGNELMQWHMLEWAHAQGYAWVDSAGVNPDPETQTPKQRGIYGFKARWGGELVRYCLYSKVYGRTRYHLVEDGKAWVKRATGRRRRAPVRVCERVPAIFPCDRILSAWSADGTSFEREPGVRVAGGAGWRRQMVYYPRVYRHHAGWRMLYHRSTRTRAHWRGEALAATSDDALAWAPGEPLRVPGLADAFLQAPCWVEFRGRRSLMLSARASRFAVYRCDLEGELPASPASALQFDRDLAVADFCVHNHRDEYLRMYLSVQGGIGSAVSTDGTVWRVEDGLRLGPGAAGMAACVNNPCLVALGDRGYRLYFRGTDRGPIGSRIYSAVSEDGLAFALEDGVRLDCDGPHEGDGVGFPHAVRCRDGWRLYYTGYWGRHLLRRRTVEGWQ